MAKILQALKILLATACLSLFFAQNFITDVSADESISQMQVDNFSQSSVSAFYLKQIKPNLSVPVGWTGDALNCMPGSSSRESKVAQLATLNAIRLLAGLPSVKQNATLNRQAQAAALMGEANNRITHTPRKGSLCFTSDGYKGANRGNLSLSFDKDPSILSESTGARAVIRYMTDSGSNNKSVGHRRWLLFPQLTEVGLGDSQRSNNIVVIGGKLSKTKAKWVSWPTAGYFPRELEPQGRWSLSYPKANFKNAFISIKTPDGLIQSIKRTVVNGFGDNTIAWDMKLPAGFYENKIEYLVTVTVSRIMLGSKSVTKTYSVTLIDADSSDNKESNQTPDPDANPNPSNPEEPAYQPQITPEMTQGYIRPKVTFLGATACTAISDGWRVTISWQLTEGNFIGRFYENYSGLRNPSQSWTISTDTEMVTSELPTGLQHFRTEGDVIFFSAMNGGWQIVDEIWFPSKTDADISGLCV